MPASLCKDCVHRMRRAFIPNEPDPTIESTILIMLTCLLSDIDISEDDTVDCNKYERKTISS